MEGNEQRTEQQSQPQDQGAQPQSQQKDKLDDKKSAIQKRIAQLYGEKKQAEEEALLYKQQLQELQAQLQATQEELAQLRLNSGVNPAVNSPLSGIGAGPVSDPDSVKKLVSEAVKEVVGPIVEEFNKNKQFQQLRLQQREAFNRAAMEFPELADPTSDLFQATDEVLRRDPKLQVDPDGPFKAALIAQGILARAQAQDGPQATPEQKKAAAAGPPGAGVPQSGSRKQLAELEQQYDQLMERLRQTTDSVEISRMWRERSALLAQIEALRAEQGETG